MPGTDGEFIAREVWLLILIASGFLVVNLGLRTSPFRRLFLRLLNKEASKLSAKECRAYVHGAAHRVTSHIHNMIAIPLGFCVLAEPQLQADPMYANSKLGISLVLLSAGYFLHDLIIVSINFSEAGFGFILHGFFCCSLYCYGVFSLQLQYFAAAFILWELSTPFVQLRWFLYEMGLKNSSLYVWNGVAMMVAFFVARLAFGGYFSYVFWVATQRELENPRPDGFQAPYIHFFRLANICLTCLNGFWFSKMARGALQLLTKGRAGDAGGSRTAAADINVVAVNGKAVNSKLD